MTVTTTTVKTVATSGPGSIPSCSSSIAANEATAAATTPRGAIAIRNPRSARPSDVPAVDASTATGRPTTISTSASTIAGTRPSRTASRSTRAPRTMNRMPSTVAPRFSLNSVMCAAGVAVWFAKAMPSRVTASRPASGRRRSAVAKAASTAARVNGTCRWSGTSRARNTPTTSAAEIRPTAAPAPNVVARRRAMRLPERSSTMASSTPMASDAPTGSIRIPSHRSTEAAGSRGRTTRRSGLITVGPDTVRIAAMRMAISASTSNRINVATVPTAHEIATPTVTRRNTGARASPNDRQWSPVPPSKSSIATPNATPVNSSSPKISSGSSTVPTPTPVISSSSTEGTRRRAARSWHAIAAPAITAIAVSGSWMVTAATPRPRRPRQPRRTSVAVNPRTG